MLLGIAVQTLDILLVRVLIDKAIIPRKFHILNLIGLVIVLTTLLQASSEFLRKLFLAAFRGRVLFDVRILLFQHLQKLSLSFFHRKDTGYLMSRISGDVGALQGLLADTMVSFAQNGLIFIAGVICTLYIHPKLALISFFILCLYILSLKAFNRRIRERSYEVRERYAIVQKDLQELLSNIFLIKAFCQEKSSAIRLVRSTKEAIRNDVRLEVFSTFTLALSRTIAAVGNIVLWWYGGAEVIRGNLTIGGLAAFSSFTGYLFGPAQALMSINLLIQKSLAACQRIFEILDLVPEVREKKQAVDPGRLRGKVSFDNVSFSYDSKGKVLDGLSLQVHRGEVVAIVGPSGVGKTTLVRLIPRFYDPQEGRVLIDGIDVQDMKLKALRENIGIVSQDTFLLNTSIRENIRFAKPKATDEEVVKAARLAGAHEFIEKLPEGYDTKIGERGVRLSGGQRQRIAMARAILKDPSILILDEAFSHLDSETERAILESLRPFIRSRTTFIIAHRLATALEADRIVVLNGGKVVGDGGHEELLESCPVYRRLYEEQFIDGRKESREAA